MALQALVIQHEDRNYLIGGNGSGSILQRPIIKLPRSEVWPSSGLRNLEILSILTIEVSQKFMLSVDMHRTFVICTTTVSINRKRAS